MPSKIINSFIVNNGLARDIEEMIHHSLRSVCEDSDAADALKRRLARDIEVVVITALLRNFIGEFTGNTKPHDDSHLTLQERIAAWARTVFPHDDPDAATGGVLAHFLEEVGELVVAYNDGGDVREEAADIMHLLFQLAEFGGFDLLDETERKFAINRKRTWGTPDANGVVHHIKESEPYDATAARETT